MSLKLKLFNKNRSYHYGNFVKIITCEEELLFEANNSQYIIVVGEGKQVLYFLDNLYDKIQNKQFYYLENESIPDNARDYAISLSIKDLPNISDALIIKVPGLTANDLLLKKIQELGFHNIVYISDLYFLDAKSKERYDKINNEIINDKVMPLLQHSSVNDDYMMYMLRKQELLQYQCNNRLKLEKLRQTYQNTNRKIKVLFLVSSLAKFGMGSVYRAMKDKERFQPIICLFDEYINQHFSKEDSKIRIEVDKLKEDGYDVIWDYDANSILHVLRKAEPDIVFFMSPYIEECILTYITYNYLTCYIPYGMYLANSIVYHFKQRITGSTWLNIFDTSFSFNLYLRHSEIQGVNALLAGYPKLDELYKNNIRIPDKINNGKKIIIYAPHHSVQIDKSVTFSALSTSTFDLYYKNFLDMVRKNQDINFVYKPHPTLPDRIKQLEEIGKAPLTYQEYIQFCDDWNRCENGIIIEDDSYIDLFQISECLITDCGSFIGEWLATEKPCIYLMNSDDPNLWNQFYDFAQRILKSYYLCNSWESIEKVFNDVIINHKDPLKERRISEKERFFYNLGHSGEFIADYIEHQLNM